LFISPYDKMVKIYFNHILVRINEIYVHLDSYLCSCQKPFRKIAMSFPPRTPASRCGVNSVRGVNPILLCEVARYAARVSFVSMLLRLRPQLLLKPLVRRNSAVLEINRPDSGLTQSRTAMLLIRKIKNLTLRQSPVEDVYLIEYSCEACPHFSIRARTSDTYDCDGF